MLWVIYGLTLFWRRRVDEFEVLAAGIPRERVRLKSDPSPVAFDKAARPLPRPGESDGKLLLLYSGNWGVARDYRTFLAGYAMHHRDGTGRFVLRTPSAAP